MKAKEQKRAEAEARAYSTRKVSARDQLAAISERPGESRRERTRLEGYLARNAESV